MKKTILTAAALAMLTLGSANAADMAVPPQVYKAPPPPPPSWTGCYVSAGWGYGMFDDQLSTNNGNPNTTSAGKGWLGAFGGGCDYQFNASPIGPIVIGAFADYDIMNITGNFNDPFNSAHSGTQTETAAWYAGGRAGILVSPNLLTYFDGGWTGAQFGQINIVNAAGAPVDGGLFLPSATPNGWFTGFGVEYAFTWLPINGLFWKNEYRFASYQNYTQNYIHPFGPGAAAVSHSIDTQTVTSSLVWRFNWTGH
jgi:outer membrane immunogenic protein